MVMSPMVSVHSSTTPAPGGLWGAGPQPPPLSPPGECVIALKSMIGSTAQQFLTYLSHRGEETGNIRGSMKVRVPTERLGTRERLYGEDPSPQGGQWGQDSTTEHLFPDRVDQRR